MDKTTPESFHLGRKVKRIREIIGIKQETLANGLNISKQRVSKVEQKEIISDERLEKIAQIMGVTVDQIKNFNEDSVFQNNIFDQNNTVINYQNNGSLDIKTEELYEALLASEREKNVILKKLLEVKGITFPEGQSDKV